ncbi:uncharacterized protein LOC105772469 isoform X2 [Gossypium raimondii]|uniref:uncharacterized protein LOC105772469 isoform X2 n=1 Tax=Gossypium raimondii TaxID=29730 RepID=UPI00227BBA33|nr:uncharacterized protein LOC105772469 isoform X2 [Gossypium raimondii]
MNNLNSGNKTPPFLSIFVCWVLAQIDSRARKNSKTLYCDSLCHFCFWDFWTPLLNQTAKSGGASLPTHIEKFYETIGLEVQNGYGLIETSPCVAGRQPYYNVYNSLFCSVFEIYRYGSVCFFLVAFSETDFRFRHHCFVSCSKSIDLDLFVLFVGFLCTFSSGIQKRISSSPNAIKLIVFSFISISLAYTELKRIYEVMAIFVKLKLNSADSLLMLYVVMHSPMA